MAAPSTERARRAKARPGIAADLEALRLSTRDLVLVAAAIAVEGDDPVLVGQSSGVDGVTRRMITAAKKRYPLIAAGDPAGVVPHLLQVIHSATQRVQTEMTMIPIQNVAYAVGTAVKSLQQVVDLTAKTAAKSDPPRILVGIADDDGGTLAVAAPIDDAG